MYTKIFQNPRAKKLELDQNLEFQLVFIARIIFHSREASTLRLSNKSRRRPAVVSRSVAESHEVARSFYEL